MRLTKHFTVPNPGANPGECSRCLNCSLYEAHLGKCDCSCRGARTWWQAYDLTKVPVDEPLLLSLAKFRLYEDRRPLDSPENANLIASKTRFGKHLPIIDLDYDHRYVPSTSTGHAHLYLNVPISRWRWVILMIGLRIGGVIERGTFVWSLRRGANFVRKPGVLKVDAKDGGRASYGWLFRKRRSRGTKK